MAHKTYIVDGRQFRTESDYRDAMYDKEIIEKLRRNSAGFTLSQLKNLLARVEKGEFHFRTLLGQDLEDELKDRIRRLEREGEGKKGASRAKENAKKPAAAKPAQQTGKAKTSGAQTGARTANRAAESRPDAEEALQRERALEEAVRRELMRREKRRKLFLLLSGGAAVVCLGIFGLYAYQGSRSQRQSEKLGALIGSQTPGAQKAPEAAGSGNAPVQVNLDGERVIPDVLEEYKIIYNQHKKLIGWLKFDDKEIGGKYGFPVMQTGDNEFFLSHDIELRSDKNGTIFLDTNCDVLKPSTNFILYGHHMKSGAMFGNLDRYAREEYWKKYPYLSFDTIYEKGTYEVMYAFRSRVYSEEEITFKYYQFIDALSEQEFDSYMEEMAKMSLYDTGVVASFGDQLLTLSTCDYQEPDGRFVVVAKKVASREK